MKLKRVKVMLRPVIEAVEATANIEYFNNVSYWEVRDGLLYIYGPYEKYDDSEQTFAPVIATINYWIWIKVD